MSAQKAKVLQDLRQEFPLRPLFEIAQLHDLISACSKYGDLYFEPDRGWLSALQHGCPDVMGYEGAVTDTDVSVLVK